MDATTVQLPEPLFSKLEDVAREEHRTIEEVLRDAIDQYTGRWSLPKLFAYGEERAKTLNLSETDVDRLIAEFRAEQQHR